MELWQKIKAFVWSKHFLKHSGYILITYIVIVGGTILYLDAFTNHGEKIKLPNLVGMPSVKAQAALEELDLKMELLDSVYRPDLPAGTTSYIKIIGLCEIWENHSCARFKTYTFS